MLVVVAGTCISASAGAQSFVDRLNAKLNKWGGTATGTQQAAPAALLAPISPSQSAAIDQLLAQPIDDQQIAADRREALPLIKILLSTGACARDEGAWNATNRYQLEPTTFTGGLPWLVPDKQTKYHDQSKCMDVVRLVDWSKPARNALRFRAYYIAEDSGEAGNQKFEIQKGSDGQWLIRDIGWGTF